MEIIKVSKRLREILDSAAPGQIEKAVIFGSQITGNPSPDSDLDILVIVKGACGWQMQKTILRACYAINLEFDVITDIKIHGSDELNLPGRTRKYITNALEFGIAA